MSYKLYDKVYFNGALHMVVATEDITQQPRQDEVFIEQQAEEPGRSVQVFDYALSRHEGFDEKGVGRFSGYIPVMEAQLSDATADFARLEEAALQQAKSAINK